MKRFIQSSAMAVLLIGSLGSVGANGQAASQNSAPQQNPIPQPSGPTTAPAARWFTTTGTAGPVDQQKGWVEIAMEPAAAAQPKPVTYLGVSLESPAEAIRTQLQLQDDVGLLITWVDDQGPAKEVLAKHDVIVRLDDQIVVNSEQFQALVRMHKPGDVLNIRVVRHAQPVQVAVKLSEKNVASTAFPYWANDKLVAFEGSSPIYIVSSAAAGPTTAPTTQPVNALSAVTWIEGSLQGSKPDAPPDRATVVRRLYLDVTGLPPSPAQIKSFVDDKSPDAYEKLVQEVLKNRPSVIQQQ